jgi:hypothetical protein
MFSDHLSFLLSLLTLLKNDVVFLGRRLQSWLSCLEAKRWDGNTPRLQDTKLSWLLMLKGNP